MVGPGATCALCGLKISGRPVAKTFAGREESFCCQGCARVYQLGLETDTLEATLARFQARRSTAKDAPAAGKVCRFHVTGMECAHCLEAVTDALEKQPGVLSVHLDLASGDGELRYQPGVADPVRALGCLDALGYTARLAER